MKRPLKALIIVFAATAGLIILLAIMFARWARNPYGMEEERIAPKGKEHLPAIMPVPNSVSYLLFQAYEKNRFAIQLPVPYEYFHPSRVTSAILKTYGASVEMYYPELHSVFHPNNSHLQGCGGYCGGLARAYIEVRENGASEHNEWQLARLKKDREANNQRAPFEDLQGEFGISERFQIRRPAVNKHALDERHMFQEYLIKRSAKGAVMYVFECSPYSPSPGCSVEFNLSSRPELLVKLHFGRHLMGSWESLIQSVDRKIGSWHPVRVETITN